ncbi:MAG TPA: SRPBCC domain-containing protein [Acidimicrobiia bacterium]|jgi:uncharacterized protein YndB with AHSA1/START domain
MSTVEVVETLDGSPAEVWPMVSEPELLQEWLDDEVELTLEVGAPVRTRGEHGVRVGVVDEVEFGRRLAFTWVPAAPDEGPVTTVEVELEAGDDGEHTVLRITERLVDTSVLLGLPARGDFLALAGR